jgi:hypothetical protein
MTDKELLELAAKAAGMEYPAGQTYCETLGVWGMLEKRPYHWWNPLTDDGDALRLAVKLNMFVCIREDKYINAGDSNIMIAILSNGDNYSETRRSIVRAAAEIGKRMP